MTMLMNRCSRVVSLTAIARRSYASSSSSSSTKPPVVGAVIGVRPGLSLTSSSNSQLSSANEYLLDVARGGAQLKGKSGECKLVYLPQGASSSSGISQAALVGLGEESSTKTVRDATNKAVKALRESGATRILVDDLSHPHQAAEGAYLAAYWEESLKSEANRKKRVDIEPLNSSIASSSSSSSTSGSFEKLGWNTGVIYAGAQNWARMLADTPANHMTPSIFANTVQEKFAEFGSNAVKVNVYGEEWAKEKGMGAFLSVARGSVEPLKFVEIIYRGNPSSNESTDIGLVGKGVTFDTGGISIKPSQGMEMMRGDMGGAASVVGAMYGIAKLGLPINVTAVTPLCENMPSGNATKPGDVVYAMNGKSIEVLNTDAEGRLILADALYYMTTQHKPKRMIDVATLTGAIVVALGYTYSGVYSTTNALWQQLDQASQTVDDPFWRMPLHSEFVNGVTKESKLADLANISPGRWAGSCTAAAFLREFIQPVKATEAVSAGAEDADGEQSEKDQSIDLNNQTDIPEWSHIDIAGSGMLDSAKTMTGRPTRALIEFARNISNSH
ncbi:hypothetical protein GQ42DRAFT_161926 [Ramicandelaber brevisporus]|nr:hypothetical protein GQ42DRAFT_161926 [Ramicandelaber brevisporus]